MFYQEPKHIGDLLLVEVKSGWTKDKVPFAKAAAPVPLGTVLAQVDGKYVAYDPANAETAPAIAIAAETVDSTEAERPSVVIGRGATVAIDELIWPEGITDVQRTAALASLSALGIIARTTL